EVVLTMPTPGLQFRLRISVCGSWSPGGQAVQQHLGAARNQRASDPRDLLRSGVVLRDARLDDDTGSGPRCRAEGSCWGREDVRRDIEADLRLGDVESGDELYVIDLE